jgi:hypothetical protein
MNKAHPLVATVNTNTHLKEISLIPTHTVTITVMVSSTIMLGTINMLDIAQRFLNDASLSV